MNRYVIRAVLYAKRRRLYFRTKKEAIELRKALGIKAAIHKL